MAITVNPAPEPIPVPPNPNNIPNSCKTTFKGNTKLKASLLIAALSALALNGMYQAAKSKNVPKCLYKESIGSIGQVPPEQQGYMGQDIYNPRDPYNNDDPDSPFYQTKGMFGQNIYDASNPYNKEDPQSPYYDPNYKKS